MIYKILCFYYRNSISNAKVPTAERPVSPTSTFDRASLNSALTLSSSHGLPVSINQVFAYRVISCFCCRLLTFSKLTFSKNSFKNTFKVSNSLDPDQDRHPVGPDLDSNCLQRLSAGDRSGPKQGK